jgi:hypothetical protein
VSVEWLALAAALGVLGLAAVLVTRAAWRLSRLVQEGVATSATVLEKYRTSRRSYVRYEFRTPDGARHEGAFAVEAEAWQAHAVGGPIRIAYAASRPWISGDPDEVDHFRRLRELPPL